MVPPPAPEEANPLNFQEDPTLLPQIQRSLIPISTFNSMTVWNPDVLLDQGDDCYVRAIKEWTALANIVGHERTVT